MTAADNRQENMEAPETRQQNGAPAEGGSFAFAAGGPDTGAAGGQTDTLAKKTGDMPLGAAGRGMGAGAGISPGDAAAYQRGVTGRRALSLRSAEFRRGREEGWRKLESMVDRVEKYGISVLSASEAEELPLLYRAAMSSLSVARNIVLDRNLLLYLENLSMRAYLVVYGPRTGLLENMRDFFVRGFPDAVRSMRWHLLVAFVVMLAGAIAGYVLVMNDMSYYDMFLPEGLAQGRTPSSSVEYLRSVLFSPWSGFVDTFIVFANSLFRHNSMVGILCFGLGFALGIPTIILLTYNGLVLGAFIALHVDKGLGVDAVGWLSIHGVTEILAILLCAGAGLVIAEKILFPGSLPRLENLSRNGRKAGTVIAGAVLMLFIAGILEGGFRQLINVTSGRYAFAAVTGALWLGYFTLVGKGSSHGNKN